MLEIAAGVAGPLILGTGGWLGFSWIADQNDTREVRTAYPGYQGLVRDLRR